MTYSFSAVIEKEGKLFVALCPELDIASQGKSRNSAAQNLREAVRLFLETASPAELKSARASRPFITTLEVAV